MNLGVVRQIFSTWDPMANKDYLIEFQNQVKSLRRKKIDYNKFGDFAYKKLSFVALFVWLISILIGPAQNPFWLTSFLFICVVVVLVEHWNTNARLLTLEDDVHSLRVKLDDLTKKSASWDGIVISCRLNQTMGRWDSCKNDLSRAKNNYLNHLKNLQEIEDWDLYQSQDRVEGYYNYEKDLRDRIEELQWFWQTHLESLKLDLKIESFDLTTPKTNSDPHRSIGSNWDNVPLDIQLRVKKTQELIQKANDFVESVEKQLASLIRKGMLAGDTLRI